MTDIEKWLVFTTIGANLVILTPFIWSHFKNAGQIISVIGYLKDIKYQVEANGNSSSHDLRLKTMTLKDLNLLQFDKFIELDEGQKRVEVTVKRSEILVERRIAHLIRHILADDLQASVLWAESQKILADEIEEQSREARRRIEQSK